MPSRLFNFAAFYLLIYFLHMPSRLFKFAAFEIGAIVRLQQSPRAGFVNFPWLRPVKKVENIGWATDGFMLKQAMSRV